MSTLKSSAASPTVAAGVYTGVALHRIAGRAAPAGRVYSYLHHAVDDYSRTVYSEILTDTKKHTAAGFMRRALQFFSGHGVEVTRVMTGNR